MEGDNVDKFCQQSRQRYQRCGSFSNSYWNRKSMCPVGCRGSLEAYATRGGGTGVAQQRRQSEGRWPMGLDGGDGPPCAGPLRRHWSMVRGERTGCAVATVRMRRYREGPATGIASAARGCGGLIWHLQGPFSFFEWQQPTDTVTCSHRQQSAEDALWLPGIWGSGA